MSLEIPVQFVVMKYIHWENILILNQLLKNNKIKRLESKKVKIRDEIIKIETRIEELNHRENELNFEKQEKKDISELQNSLII